MYFFTPHPFVSYDPTGQNAPSVVVDITKRFKITDLVKNSRLVFYEYTVKDRDRPDIMAEAYYGNAQLDWVFFMTNTIWDPYFQWPMNQMQFEAFIRSKYGSTSVAMSQVHHYEQIVNKRKELFTNFDGTQITVPEKSVVVDFATYSGLAPDMRRIVSNFDYEESRNEARRNIKILEKAYLPTLLREFKQVFNS